MDTDGLKALQTLGDAGHFSIFNGARKEIPSSVKLTARSADAWCASALFPSGGTKPFVWGLGGSLGPISCTFSDLNRY
jgi:hypothetical protein